MLGWLFPSLNSVHASSHRLHPTHLVGSARIIPLALVMIGIAGEANPLAPASPPNADSAARLIPVEAESFRKPLLVVSLPARASTFPLIPSSIDISCLPRHFGSYLLLAASSSARTPWCRQKSARRSYSFQVKMRG